MVYGLSGLELSCRILRTTESDPKPPRNFLKPRGKSTSFHRKPEKGQKPRTAMCGLAFGDVSLDIGSRILFDTMCGMQTAATSQV